MSNAALEKLVWVLIYGGLLVVCMSVFVARLGGGFAWTLGLAGAVSALVGGLLILVRARRGESQRS